MRIALITIYDLDNYGNRLQNYATVKYFARKGYDIETVNVEYFTLIKLIKNLFKKILRKTIYYDWNILQERPEYVDSLSRIEKERYNNFKIFTYKHIPPRKITIIKYLKNANWFKYDFWIVGSDQVWNPNIGQALEWEFLNFVPNYKRISWSASFGVDQIEDKDGKISAELKKFKKITVREKNGEKIVKELTGRNADVIIDPTLLLTRDEWANIAEKPEKVNLEEPYIVTYFLGEKTSKIQDEIEEYANKMKAKVYDLLDKEKREFYVLGPENFIYLIEHAKLIITDSFHACVFSFLFKTPFLVYKRTGKNCEMMSRIKTFLDTFFLQRKYVDSGLENDILECDYQKGYEILKKEQEKVDNIIIHIFDKRGER